MRLYNLLERLIVEIIPANLRPDPVPLLGCGGTTQSVFFLYTKETALTSKRASYLPVVCSKTLGRRAGQLPDWWPGQWYRNARKYLRQVEGKDMPN